MSAVALRTGGDLLVGSQLYGLAARLLADPTRALDGDALDRLEHLASGSTGLGRIGSAVAKVRTVLRDVPRTRRAVAQEHTELVLKGAVAAHEASYVPAMQGLTALADVSGFLRAFGVRAAGERPDHMVAELEFLALLSLKESVALGSDRPDEAAVCREAHAAFLRDHLGRWLGAYRGALAERAPGSLVLALVDVARSVVDTDVAALGVVPEQIAEVPRVGDEAPPTCGVVG
ncbi:MAG: TorD/DmsD family molecular chaperone [Methanobacteriota archaeon]